MKTKNEKTSSNAALERVVEESRAVSITVEGGKMTGEFVKAATRYSKDGDAYHGWIMKNATGIIEDRKTGKGIPAPSGRYFLFGAKRLDRQMRELERGERVEISYLGLVQNEVAGPEGDFGKHHAFKVVYLD